MFPNNGSRSVKAGYPTRHLTLVPELPVSSLGLKAGDQIIVTAKGGSLSESNASPASTLPSSSISNTSGPQASPLATSVLAPSAKVTASGADYVETGSGVLVHRVSSYSHYPTAVTPDLGFRSYQMTIHVYSVPSLWFLKVGWVGLKAYVEVRRSRLNRNTLSIMI